MFDAAGNDAKLPGFQDDALIAKFNRHFTTPHEKHLIFAFVMMPRKDSLDFHKLNLLAIQLRNDFWPPMFVNGREFFIQRRFHGGGGLLAKFKLLTMGDEPTVMGLAEKTANGFPAPLAIVKGPVVDVHSDEFVGEIAAHVAGILKGVLHGLRAMVQAILDAGRKDSGDDLANHRVKAFMDDIAAQRQRQTTVLAAPPDAQIFTDLKPFLLVSELAFMDDEADVSFAGTDGFEDLVEWNNDVVKLFGRFAEPKLQSEEGAGHRAGDSDFLAQHFAPGEPLPGDEHRAISIAHAGATGQQRVFVTHISIGMDADGRDVEFAAGGALVEGLDILKDVLEAVAIGRNQLFGQAVEHEGVIRVGRVAQGECFLRHLGKVRACAIPGKRILPETHRVGLGRIGLRFG